MDLTRQQQEMLDGKHGRGMAKAMEILLAYGKCYDAKRLIPVTSVHIAGNFSVLFEEGVEWLETLADEGAKVCVFTTKNPELYDPEQVDEMNIPEHYRNMQERIRDAVQKMGITPTYSCHHYLVGNAPRFGDHIAWASSGSQVFANSVIGARSNRDGDHVALAAAITGVIPEWGMHLDENRKADVLIDVAGLDIENYGPADFKALGWHLGKTVSSGIPAFVNLPPDLHIEKIKGLLYTMTVTGAAGLIHLVGITPEAPTVEAAFGGKVPDVPAIMPTQADVDLAYTQISCADSDKIEFVLFGCPQCSIQEVQEIAQLLDGRKIHPDTQLWVCTSRWVKTLCERMGLLETLSRSGVRVASDIGANSPHIYLKEQGVRVVALNSARACYYTHNLSGLQTWFGSTQECIESAISGKWEGRKK